MRKGVLIEDTYRCLAAWDTSRPLRENILRIRQLNPIGASNNAWLREVTATLSNRFAHGDPIRSLAALARGGLSLEVWKYCYLWHMTSTDGLLLAFMRDFLNPKTREGTAVFTTDDTIPWVIALKASGTFAEPLSDYGVRRMARDLLRAASEFGFLQGAARREVIHPVVPEDAILYAIYSLWDQRQSVERLVASDRWAMFLMLPPDVERELLNLHQFRRVRYERAGSISELHLPYPSLAAFSESLVS
jgi:hypothetical protein